jgi:hypothetical protein
VSSSATDGIDLGLGFFCREKTAMNTTRMLGLSAALLLFLAACGDSAEEAAAPATEEGAATTEGETGTEEKTTQ